MTHEGGLNKRRESRKTNNIIDMISFTTFLNSCIYSKYQHF